MKRARSQRFSRPARQYGHAPHVQPSHGTPTRSPGENASGARHDLGDDLVTGDERELRPGQLAVDDVQVGAADAAREHAEERLSRAGLGIGQLGLPKRRASRRQHHRPHRRSTLLVMRELLDYRTEFPILEQTTYLINHSLAAMPRRAEDRLAEYARMWAERGIRAWGEGWWTMPMTVGDQVGPDRRRAGGDDRDAPERRGRRGGRALVLPPVRPRRATGSSTSAATSRPCATSTRRSRTSRSSSARTTKRRSSTRSTSGRCSSRSATSSSRRARSRTSSRSSAAPTRSART